MDGTSNRMQPKRPARYRILWENPEIWNTSNKQDVVQIAIEPESSPAGLIPDNGNRPMHLDNSHTIEIEADGLLIRMSNEIKPVLLKMLMDTLTELLCSTKD